MKRTFAVILTLIAIAGLQTVAFSQTGPDIDDPVDDASPVARAARLRFIEGEVSFLRAGTSEWSDAATNLPLLTGDQVYVGPDGRAEIQLSGGAFIRLLKETTLTVTELSDTASQFEITQGTALVKVNQLASPPYRFEVDTPNSALVLDADGLYSLTVFDSQRSEVIVNRGAAEVSSDDGTIKVREGHRLTIDLGSTSRFELAAGSGEDWWNDEWTTIADSSVSTGVAPDDVTTYESNYVSFFGASDLARYGSWTNNSSYGYCWVPRVDSNWAPYRYGRWLWIPNAGWTWLADENWGWAPYHYGRWAFIQGLGWAWVPGFGGYGRNYGGWDYRWRPSLVYFFNYPTSRGSYIGWCPLSPGQRWHRPEWYDRRRDRRHAQNPRPSDGRRPGRERRWIDPPRTPRAITAVPVEAFQSPTKSVVQRGNLARDTSDVIDRAANPGLPAITPKGGAIQFNDGKHGRRTVAPSVEVLARPVVTRHRPANADAETSVPRERRLIAPRPVTTVTDATNEDSQNRKRDESRKYRITIPAPVEKTSVRKGSESPNSEGTDANAGQKKAERQEKRRAREQQQFATPAPPRVVQPPRSAGQNDVSQQDHNSQTHAERKQERQERREMRQEKRAESGGRRKP